MPLKFAANMSMLFTEAASLESRYALAKYAGFKAVECMFPYDVPLDKLVAAKKSSGLTHVLINSYPGRRVYDYRGDRAFTGTLLSEPRKVQRILLGCSTTKRVFGSECPGFSRWST